jgi:hypothetical protein
MADNRAALDGVIEDGETSFDPFQRVSGASNRYVLRKSAVESRLRHAGIKSNAVADFVYREGNNFAGLQDPEDILHEAIIAHLTGEHLRHHVWRFAKVGHKELSIDLFATKTEDQEWFYSVLEERSSDNERGDWIPDDPAKKAKIYRECAEALARPYTPKKPYRQRKGSSKLFYYGFVVLMKRRQFIGYFDTDLERDAAERDSLRRIMGWVSDDGSKNDSPGAETPMQTPETAETIAKTMVFRRARKRGVS